MIEQGLVSCSDLHKRGLLYTVLVLWLSPGPTIHLVKWSQGCTSTVVFLLAQQLLPVMGLSRSSWLVVFPAFSVNEMKHETTVV